MGVSDSRVVEDRADEAGYQRETADAVKDQWGQYSRSFLLEGSFRRHRQESDLRAAISMPLEGLETTSLRQLYDANRLQHDE